MSKEGCFKHQPRRNSNKRKNQYSLISFNQVIDLTAIITFSELSNKNPLALIL